MKRRPVIGVTCCLRSLAFGDYPPTPHHTVFHKYVDFVADRLMAMPMLIPAHPGAIDDDEELEELVSRLDGLLLTGSPSNVGVRYSEAGQRIITPKGSADHARDMTTTPLIRASVAAGVPILGICRGLQEMNVAFGGDLHDEVHLVPGCADHRSDKSLPYDQRYHPRHDVRVLPGSPLDALLASAKVEPRTFRVNSLHGQAVSLCGNAIRVAAMAEDGVIEAISVDNASAFAMGVQWHIEWADADQVLDRTIADAFLAACKQRLACRHGLAAEAHA